MRGDRPKPAAAYDRDGVLEQEVNVLALVKGEERYVFVYTGEQRDEMLRTLGRFAANTELSFTWYDAAVLSQKVRELNS